MKKRVNNFISLYHAVLLTFIVLISTAAVGLGSAESASAAICMEGEISYSGSDELYGYTTDYVKYDGSCETQHIVYDGWHITAYDSYDSHGITWYECWDTDDGDYYGWIDESYLLFYSTNKETRIDVISITPRRAEVNGSGVYGYTSDYVLYYGSMETQHKVKDGWHITAYNTAYSHGITWYECWDTDDGDYYGWIDQNFISFYDEMVVTSVVTVPVTLPAETVTVPVTLPAQTVMVTVNVPVTENANQAETEPVPQTEEATYTTRTVTAFEAELAEKDDSSQSGSFNVILLLIILAIIIIIIIAIVTLLIVLLVKTSKKSKTNAASAAADYNQDDYNSNYTSEQESDYCIYCGEKRADPRDAFCRKCGKPYDEQQ